MRRVSASTNKSFANNLLVEERESCYNFPVILLVGLIVSAFSQPISAQGTALETSSTDERCKLLAQKPEQRWTFVQ